MKDQYKKSKMNESKSVTIIGGGVIGCCSALFLSRAGYRVTVLEREKYFGNGTSFANAGRFCPTAVASYPISSPHVISQVLRLPLQIFTKLKNNLIMNDKQSNEQDSFRSNGDMPSSISWSFSLIKWGMVFLRNCTPARYESNNEIFKNLARMSIDTTTSIISTLPRRNKSIDWKEGNLSVHEKENFSEGSLAQARKAGYTNTEQLECDDCKSRFPFVNSYLSRMKDAGMNAVCVLTRDDASADCRKFLHEIVALASSSSNPVTFKTQVELVDVQKQIGHVESITILDNESREYAISSDYYVFCGGPWTQIMFEKFFRKNLYIQGVRGCSIDLHGVKNAPPVALVDKVSGSLNFQITPFDNGRIRLIGFADFEKIPPKCVDCDPNYMETLLKRTRFLLPEMSFDPPPNPPWCGLRPQTPDSLPIIGRVRDMDNVFVNAGHGSIGWTLACGSAQFLCALLTKNDPDHDDLFADQLLEKYALRIDSFSPERFSLWNLLFQ